MTQAGRRHLDLGPAFKSPSRSSYVNWFPDKQGQLTSGQRRATKTHPPASTADRDRRHRAVERDVGATLIDASASPPALHRSIRSSRPPPASADGVTHAMSEPASGLPGCATPGLVLVRRAGGGRLYEVAEFLDGLTSTCDARPKRLPPGRATRMPAESRLWRRVGQAGAAARGGEFCRPAEVTTLAAA